MNRDLVAVPIPCALECRVVANELDYITVSWARPLSERLNEALGDGAEPAPGTAKSDFGEAHDFSAIWITAQKRTSQEIEKGRIGRRAEQ
jgi:hypothetical protein